MQRKQNIGKLASFIGTKSLANWKSGLVGEITTIDG
jgi:hypothetical protein